MTIRKRKKSKGNITILVLIISLVAILAMTTLTRFVFREVGFTNIDQKKQIALNLAEAGITDLFYDIERFHDYEIPSLPDSPYTEDVEDSDGNDLGTFTVDYEEVYDDEDKLTNYIITSTGTALNGTDRTVQINLAVSFSTEVNIYEYIYTRDSMTYNGLERIIQGPFFVAGNLNLRALSALNDSFASGEILIGGNLDIGELSYIDTGPISVGGDLEMGGLYATIDHDFEEPLIVMGDLRMRGNTRIGTSSDPINLSCAGVVDVESPARLYYSPPIGDDLFDPPKLDVAVYVENFKDQLEGPPRTGMTLDEDYIIGGVFRLDRDLLTPEEPIFLESDGENIIRFENIDEDEYLLTINGNIIVEGDMVIGEDIDDDDQYRIEYDGVGKILTTGSIHIYPRIYPEDTGDFPVSDFLILMARENIDLEVIDYRNYFGRCSQPDLYLMAISGGTTKLYRHICLKGSVMCGSLDTSDGWLSSWARICYQDGLADSLPEDLPQLIYGGATFNKEWQEVVD